MKRTRIISLCMVIALLALTTVASATFTPYTSETAFLNQLASGYYLEDFTGVYYLRHRRHFHGAYIRRWDLGTW